LCEVSLANYFAAAVGMLSCKASALWTSSSSNFQRLT